MAEEQREFYVEEPESKLKNKDQRPPIARDLKLVSHEVQNIEQMTDMQQDIRHKNKVQSYGESFNNKSMVGSS